MREKLRAYIEKIFEAAPQTEKVKKLKEELLSKITLKYDELTAQGFSEEEAYNKAAGSADGFAELINGAKCTQYSGDNVKSEKSNKHALIISAAIGLYFIAIAVLILLSMIGNRGAEIGCVLMFVIAGIATSMLIYNGITYRRGPDETDHSSDKTDNMIDGSRTIYKTCVTILWLTIVVIYFVISFAFGAWMYSWIIFIIACILNNIMKLIFEARNNK